MSSLVTSPVRSVAGKITRSGLVTRSSRPPASTIVASAAGMRSSCTATPTTLPDDRCASFAIDEGAGEAAGGGGTLARGRARARDRVERRADPRAQDRHLRHRPAHLRLGRLGAAARSRCRWSSGTSSSARWSSFGSNVSDFAVGDLVSGEGHVVCGRCRNCMAGRRHLCAHSIGLGVNRPGAFAEYVALPMTNIWHHWQGVDEDVASIFDPFGNAVHTALSFPRAGRGRAGDGRRADRLHGGGGRAPRGRAPRGGHRRQPLPARAGPPDGRDGGGRSARARAADVQRGARHDRGLRRRARDVGQPGRAARDGREHGPRRPDRAARHPHRRRSRWTSTR